MQSQKQNPQLREILTGVISIIAIVCALWFALSTYPSNAPAVVQTTQPIEKSIPYPAPSSIVLTPNPMSTQDEIETLVALKQAEGTKAIQDFTTTPQLTQEPFATGTRVSDRTAFQWRQFGLEIENAWVGLVDGNRVTLWAGALTKDSSQGIVQLIYEYPNHPLELRFLSPEKRGSLHVVAESKNRLTLISTEGVEFYFDVPGLVFVKSSDQLVPTATPLPTTTPEFPTPIILPPTGYPNAQPTNLRPQYQKRSFRILQRWRLFLAISFGLAFGALADKC